MMIKDEKITDLLLRSKVVDDVEKFANLLWGLALDHVCDSLATNVTFEIGYCLSKQRKIDTYRRDLISR